MIYNRHLELVKKFQSGDLFDYLKKTASSVVRKGSAYLNRDYSDMSFADAHKKARTNNEKTFWWRGEEKSSNIAKDRQRHDANHNKVKQKEIFVSDPSDPRIKAYKDSLSSYNNYVHNKALLESSVDNNIGVQDSQARSNEYFYNDHLGTSNPFHELKGDDIDIVAIGDTGDERVRLNKAPLPVNIVSYREKEKEKKGNPPNLYTAKVGDRWYIPGSETHKKALEKQSEMISNSIIDTEILDNKEGSKAAVIYNNPNNINEGVVFFKPNIGGGYSQYVIRNGDEVKVRGNLSHAIANNNK